ncbi:MAG TPA: hypothetical protein VM076_17020 [Gemmatimonadaceae bacterium]|nr:hypothetical protein [Gemmatimonadaceae bacterium]
MTMSPIVRARLLGSLVVILAFVAGVATGIAYQRRPREGLNVMVTATATNAMPRELEQLGLTDAQRTELRQVLTRGRDRVLTVVRQFDPAMRAAMDTTEIEVGAVLTEPQRAALAAYRREHPQRKDERIIKGPDGKEIREPR